MLTVMKTETLQSIGLGDKASAVYLAALSLGTTSVQDIARKSGLKRPTVYIQIDELIKQRLFEEVRVNNKRYYRAADPKVLEDRLARNLSHIRAAMPEFLKLRSNVPGKPRVVVYDGKEGISMVYRELKNAHSIRIWSHIEASEVPFHDVNMEVAETVREKSISVREIIADTKGARRYARLVGKVAGPTYLTRIATVDGFAHDSLIYGDVITLFRLSEHDTFVVRIEDKTIADSMKALFDMAWKTARSFK